MPFASFIKVREASSEDKIHLAENLINSQANKKWKTENVGEKSAYVILEMSESHQIVGIDIGNEHSSFVEVLVGKSSCAPEDFKEILLTCSFMTPLESKSSNNINRVRCFSKEALVPDVVNNKWSLVKIVCTQPFNKHVQYGLSFIKLHVQASQKKKELVAPRSHASDQFLSLSSNTKPNTNKGYLVSNLSKLKFREDSPESGSDDGTSLFSRWKENKDQNMSSIPATNKSKETVFRRTFCDTSPNNSNSDTAAPKILDRNRHDLAFGDENLDISSNQDKLNRLSQYIENDKDRRRLETEKIAEHKNKLIDDNKRSLQKSNDISDNAGKNLKRLTTMESSSFENKAKKIKTTAKIASFNRLLNGVVLVISGIQNPERGDLRNKALAMGAKYKSDWDSTCTHLICAFKNTPKYNQVKGKGKIVSPSWINKCYSLKKYLPWRRYALDSNDLSKPESDEEIILEPLQHQTDKTSRDKDTLLPASERESTSKLESKSKNDTLAIYDVDDRQANNSITIGQIDSDSDTDDEIKKVEESFKNNERGSIYDASTDEDDYLKEKYSQI